VPEAALAELAAVLRSGEPTVLFLGGRALREPGLVAAARIAAATGAAMIAQTFPARLERGAGLPPIDRLPYFAEHAAARLAPYRHVILVDSAEPVAFFAYPGKPSEVIAASSKVHRLAAGRDDVTAALVALADRLDATRSPPLAPARRPQLPTGPLTVEAVGHALGALLPERAIITDEANTSGQGMPSATAGAPRHDWLTVPGGAIGDGMPLALGAAIACPDRKVVCLQADGSAMYTPQALWTIAREQLDITTIVFHNAAYAILRIELQRTGAGSGGPRAREMFSLSRPSLDFVALSRSMGMSAGRATTADELVAELRRAFAEPGPYLIEAVVPPPV
jgi:acetolactate synthase-1/2/3 large subunit